MVMINEMSEFSDPNKINCKYANRKLKEFYGTSPNGNHESGMIDKRIFQYIEKIDEP